MFNRFKIDKPIFQDDRESRIYEAGLNHGETNGMIQDAIFQAVTAAALIGGSALLKWMANKDIRKHNEDDDFDMFDSYEENV